MKSKDIYYNIGHILVGIGMHDKTFTVLLAQKYTKKTLDIVQWLAIRKPNALT